MKRVVLPDEGPKRLVYYLAAEEYVADALGEGFFIWSVAPTVIFGRNQDMEAEVNLKYCRDNGIETYRRKSGGGCVYSDPGNLMLSCIMRGGNVPECFARYLDTLARALQSLGLPAVSSQHNDILVGGRKVSGNACFALGHSTIVHGTLIVEMDSDRMQKAITPSADKLLSHGVKSVRQRVASLREAGVDMPMRRIADTIASFFCDGETVLDSKAAEDILSREKIYLDPDFITKGILKSGE